MNELLVLCSHCCQGNRKVALSLCKLRSLRDRWKCSRAAEEMHNEFLEEMTLLLGQCMNKPRTMNVRWVAEAAKMWFNYISSELKDAKNRRKAAAFSEKTNFVEYHLYHVRCIGETNAHNWWFWPGSAIWWLFASFSLATQATQSSRLRSAYCYCSTVWPAALIALCSTAERSKQSPNGWPWL